MSGLNVVCVVCGLRMDQERSRTHLESVEEAKRFKEAMTGTEEEIAGVRVLS